MASANEPFTTSPCRLYSGVEVKSGRTNIVCIYAYGSITCSGIDVAVPGFNDIVTENVPGRVCDFPTTLGLSCPASDLLEGVVFKPKAKDYNVL
jgi:hypothetical protein